MDFWHPFTWYFAPFYSSRRYSSWSWSTPAALQSRGAAPVHGSMIRILGASSSRRLTPPARSDYSKAQINRALWKRGPKNPKIPPKISLLRRRGTWFLKRTPNKGTFFISVFRVSSSNHISDHSIRKRGTTSSSSWWRIPMTHDESSCIFLPPFLLSEILM